MLHRLSVHNLAVVEEAEVEFTTGFNAITGETGAGKSVLMGALELVLGGRADSSVVRDGAREAEVEAEFTGHILRRTVTAQGKSRAWIDDESVTITELRECGERMVDIHGPRANQRLLEEDFQRATLDAAVKDQSVLAAYAAAYAEYATASLELEAAESATALDEDALELLRYQIGELESAALREDDETVAERHAAAAHAEEIIGRANEITEALGGERGVAELLSSLQPGLRAISRHLPSAVEWAERIETLTVETQELSRTVAESVSRLEVGDESLEELDVRLSLLKRLQRKYLKAPCEAGGEVRRLMVILEEKRRKLIDCEHRDERIAELRRRVEAALVVVRTAGMKLTKARRSAANALAAAVTDELHGLGFANAEFTIALTSIEPSSHGCNRVVYEFGPNPGEAVRPLADIASSGEIARVMLALKIVTAARISKDDSAPFTLVFDEIDANIGGEIGRVVGEKLAVLGVKHQVIAITHLPQSAVFAERQLAVVKRVEGDRTRTAIAPVEGESRIREIARMLGGEQLTSVTRRHAEELLQLKYPRKNKS